MCFAFVTYARDPEADPDHPEADPDHPGPKRTLHVRFNRQRSSQIVKDRQGSSQIVKDRNRSSKIVTWPAYAAIQTILSSDQLFYHPGQLQPYSGGSGPLVAFVQMHKKRGSGCVHV